MGAWGAGTFENDDARDWLEQLATLTVEDIATLLVRADSSDYLEAAESGVIVAGAEAVAAWRGAPSELVPPAISEWAAKNTAPPSPDLTALAVRAVLRVRTDSELKDLWLEADGLNEWSAALRNLEQRLSG